MWELSRGLEVGGFFVLFCSLFIYGFGLVFVLGGFGVFFFLKKVLIVYSDSIRIGCWFGY